jgi:hypothetical protein
LKIAIMQPYFAPYLGYFRLLSETDLFVVLDDVQHIRRGWVHRNKLPDRNGAPQWLTLPLKKCPQETLIKDLVFADDAALRMVDIVRRFPAIERLPQDIYAALMETQGRFVPYAMRLLELHCQRGGIPFHVAYARDIPNEIGTDGLGELHGQARIIDICRQFKATTYLNSPGGRALYDPEAFKRAGIALEFLPDWTGPMESVLCALAQKEKLAA